MWNRIKRNFLILSAATLLIPTFQLDSRVLAEEATKSNIVYHETFSKVKDINGNSDNNSTTEVVTGKVFEGNEDGTSLYINNPSESGVEFSYADMGLKDGETYTVTLSVYVDEEEIVPFDSRLILQNVSLQDHENLVEDMLTAGESKIITKEITYKANVDHSLRMQLDTFGNHVPFYIGDLLITKNEEKHQVSILQDLNSVINVNFEDQTNNDFNRRGTTTTLTVSNEANHTDGGAYALKVENRTNTWHGPFLRIDNYIDLNTYYEFSAWIKLIGPESANINLNTQIGDNNAKYQSIGSKKISGSDGWVQIKGSYVYTDKGNDYVTIYLQSSDTLASFYIDDINIENKGQLIVDTELPGIKDIYEDDFLIGNAVNPEIMKGMNFQFLQHHFNTVTTSNYMKPDFLQKKKGQFTYETADQIVETALDADMKVHGHVLVWHAQSPDWFTSKIDNLGNTVVDAQGNKVPLTREEALQNMREYIQAVMHHFGDKVISWDVVNEAMTGDSPDPANWRSALRQSGWTRSVGDDFIEQAFLKARAVLDANPDMKNIRLYYNDYGLDDQNKATAVYSMVKEINDRYQQTHPGKLLIDGIGMQGHYSVNTSPQNVQKSLERFISLGVKVSFSELDINAATGGVQTESQAIKQGLLYAQLFQLFKKNADHIERVTFWGLHDGVSWRKDNSPLPFSPTLQPKPGYYGIIDPEAFILAHPPIEREINQAKATYGTPTIDGAIDEIWNTAEEISVGKYHMAWQGATGKAKVLWDEENLYVLVQVSDTQLNQSSSRVYEQDSVEFFLDQNNGKTTYYEEDDYHYRIRYDNFASFGATTNKVGVESATQVSGTNYIVEAKIPLTHVKPANGSKLGFDIQINDAKDGSRQSVASWNDDGGIGYKDTSVNGVLNLTGKPNNNSGNNGENGSGNSLGSTSGSSNNDSGNTQTKPNTKIEIKDGLVTVLPEVKVENGTVKAIITDTVMRDTLVQATKQGVTQNHIVLNISKLAEVNSYEVQIPTWSLQDQKEFEIHVATDLVTVHMPRHMLSNVNNLGEHVSIRLNQVSSQKVNNDMGNQTSTSPMVKLSLISGDREVDWSNLNTPVKVLLPYELTSEEQANPDQVVVWEFEGESKIGPIKSSRYDSVNNTVVFSTTSFNTYAVVPYTEVFNDINNVQWARQAINAMAARDIIKGTEADTFLPNEQIKRADFLALLIRAQSFEDLNGDQTMFSDVPEDAYYFKELAIAKRLGIVTGYSDKMFHPDSYISRQEMMVLAARTLNVAGKTLSTEDVVNHFTDADSISEYAQESIATLVNSGIVKGMSNGQIALNKSSTRAEAALIVYRMWKL